MPYIPAASGRGFTALTDNKQHGMPGAVNPGKFKGGGDKMIMLQEDWEREYKYAGDYQIALMRAIECADSVNLAKIEREYPELVAGYKSFINLEGTK